MRLLIVKTSSMGDVIHALPLAADIARAKEDADQRRQLESTMPQGLRFQRGWPPRLPTMGEAATIAAARSPVLQRHGLDNRFPEPVDVRRRFEELIAAQESRPHSANPARRTRS